MITFNKENVLSLIEERIEESRRVLKDETLDIYFQEDADIIDFETALIDTLTLLSRHIQQMDDVK